MVNLRPLERIIVRRGRFRTYELLRRTFGKDPNIEIIWDRRRSQTDARAENDALTEEAVAERRSRLPIEWERLDYLFTNGTRRAGSGGDDKPKDPQVQ